MDGTEDERRDGEGRRGEQGAGGAEHHGDSTCEPVPGFRASLDELIGVAFMRFAVEYTCVGNSAAGRSNAGPAPTYPCWPAVPNGPEVLISDSARVALSAARATSKEWAATVAEQRMNNIHVGGDVGKGDFVAMRESRDAELDLPALILPSIQVNIRAGHLLADFGESD